jgi:hypothetical protein
MKTLSKYDQEMQENTGMLHAVIFGKENNYLEKLIPLFNSYTFSMRDFQAVIYSIAHAHGIDITRIDVDYIVNCVGKIARNK